MRLFLALRLPPAWNEALAEHRRRLSRELSGWRWLRPDSIHLTLRFLGEVDAETDAALRPAWAAAVAGRAPFRIALGGLGTFPARRPRVLWVGIDGEPGLAGLAGALEEAARRGGLASVDRPFRPHLTLARPRRGERVTLPREQRPAPAAPPGMVREVILFQSVLDPSGARYTALESFPLSSGG